jgi:hypothetical protein
VSTSEAAATAAAASGNGRVVKVIKRPKSAGHKQLQASASEVDLRASVRPSSAKTAPMSASMVATKKSKKKLSRSENEKRLQRLSAPTFSSVARVLDTAGMNVGELQSIALASREAADMISAAAAAGDSTHAIEGSPHASKRKRRESSTIRENLY